MLQGVATIELGIRASPTLRNRCVAFSPDGRVILSGSSDKTLRLWDANSRRTMPRQRGHTNDIQSKAISPDGHGIVTGSVDHTVRLWNTESGCEFAVLEGHEKQVEMVAFSPDGRRVISMSVDNTVRIWGAESGRELVVLRAEGFRSVAFSPDGHRVATGLKDRTVRLWDVETGRELAVLCGHEDWVDSLGFSRDGSRLISGSEDMTVRLWNAESGHALNILRGHEGAIYDVTFSPDGRRVLSGSEDMTVRIWNADDGRALRVLRGHEWRIKRVAFSSDGRLALGIDWAGKSRIWNVENGKCLTRGSHTEANFQSSFPESRASVEDGQTVISLSPGGEPMAHFPEALGEGIQTHPDGRTWVGSVGTHLILLRLEGAEAIRIPIPQPQRHGEISIDELSESAEFNFRKGYWEAAEMNFQSLLARGDPIEQLAPKIVTCLLNAHQDLMAHDAAKIEALLQRLGSAGHIAVATDLRHQLEAKQPKPKKPWWKP